MKIQFIDCPHCNEAALYTRIFPGGGSALTCGHCNSVFTDKEVAAMQADQLSEQKITSVYRGCVTVSFIAIVSIGILVMWLILNQP